MFENAGAKLRVLAYVDFALFVAGGVATAIWMAWDGYDDMILIGILLGLLIIFIGWINTVTVMALADAAERSSEAVAYGEEILEQIRKLNAGEKKTVSKVEKSVFDKFEEMPPAGASFNPNKIPAWKRVQMEQEAKAKEQK